MLRLCEVVLALGEKETAHLVVIIRDHFSEFICPVRVTFFLLDLLEEL